MLSMWNLFWWSLTIVIVLDQISKFVVIRADISHYLNKWGPMGLYKKHDWFQYPLLLIHLLVLIPLFTNGNLNLFLGAGLIFGGLSNSFDRKIRKGVIDFIPVPFRILNQPIPGRINIADFAILIGIVIYGFGLTDLIK